MKLALGLVLAFGSAALLNASFYLQHQASNRLASISLRHPIASGKTLFSNPAWLVAYCGGWIGWGLYILALRYAPLSLVQATASGGLGFLALLAHRFGTTLGRRDRIAAVLAVCGLVLVCSSLAVPPTGASAPLHTVVPVVVVGLVLAGLLVGPRRGVLREGSGLAAAAGFLYAVGDVATKGAVSGSGLILVPVFLACSLVGFIAMQLAFQKGTVLATAGLSSLINAVVPIGAGIVVFHEALPSGLAGIARGGGFALCVAGAVVLAGAGEGVVI